MNQSIFLGFLTSSSPSELVEIVKSLENDEAIIPIIIFWALFNKFIELGKFHDAK